MRLRDIASAAADIPLRRRTWRRLWTIRRARPHILVQVAGSATDNPRIDVSIASRHGAIGVYDLPCDDAGHAAATLHSGTLAHITGLPVLDTRSV